MSRVGTSSAGPAPASPGVASEHERVVARPRRPAGPSVRPALVVLGIAVALVLLFGIGAALTGSSPSPAPHASPVHGTSLPAEPAAAGLRPIELPGTPPSDVLGSLVLPKGAVARSSVKWDGSTQYSATMRFDVGTSQGAVVGFYRAELKARGWSIQDVGAARAQHGATEVLAQRPSADGWYWEAGVVVSPTTFGAGGAAPETTRFTLELYEMPDAT